MMQLAAVAESAITEAYAPHGMNMGINLGKPAGAGVPGHIHLHVVPRYEGDGFGGRSSSVHADRARIPTRVPAAMPRKR